ncbi:Periplasmic zinc-binding protein TroA precursor [Planctomycetes bacterium Pla163]|uniref:Periplasmic zinc-binding protein TroA n=1 Tax=Rohdeia mirabilis TaxID=2528008 RepID=A0A518D009_9BACT|nr:Periplasmic zinc-binding protein TroA precursor [Planctomycetes bacterium Pla163]
MSEQAAPLRRERRTFALGLLAGVFGLLLVPTCTSCGGADESQAETRPLVLSTIGQIHDIASTLAGDDLRTEVLLGAGLDPHTHRPTRADAARLTAADLVLENGLHLEALLHATLDARRASARPVVAVGESIPAEQRLAVGGAGALADDPHLWMDPVLWAEVARAVARELSDLAPAAAPDIARRLEGVLAELAELDAYARRSIDSIPAERRLLVTAHDAFGYFGRRYGIEVASVQGISTESEASVRHVQELVNLLVEREVPAIFVESSVSVRGPRALVEGAAARGHQVVVAGELYSDSMGPPGTYRGTYVGMLDHNITLITRALGGDAPAAGLRDRL